MGTRSDYYVGRGATAEWLGSAANDGYFDGVPCAIREATSEAAFRAAVTEYLTSRRDGTTPDLGWPWPWEDSATTDYAYAFDTDAVYASHYGCPWVPAAGKESVHPENGEPPVFPDMTARKAVTFGARSGLIVFGR